MTAAKKTAARKRQTKSSPGDTPTREVIFAVEHQTADGEIHAGGDKATLPAAEARELIHGGRARDAKAQRVAKKAAAPKPAGKPPTTADPGNGAPPNGDGEPHQEGNAS